MKNTKRTQKMGVLAVRKWGYRCLRSSSTVSAFPARVREGAVSVRQKSPNRLIKHPRGTRGMGGLLAPDLYWYNRRIQSAQT